MTHDYKQVEMAIDGFRVDVKMSRLGDVFDAELERRVLESLDRRTGTLGTALQRTLEKDRSLAFSVLASHRLPEDISVEVFIEAAKNVCVRFEWRANGERFVHSYLLLHGYVRSELNIGVKRVLQDYERTTKPKAPEIPRFRLTTEWYTGNIQVGMIDAINGNSRAFNDLMNSVLGRFLGYRLDERMIDKIEKAVKHELIVAVQSGRLVADDASRKWYYSR